METTRLSTKGQIVLPKALRTSRAWRPGTEFTVEETSDGVLLRPAGGVSETDLEQVAGCLRSKRKSKTPAQMAVAIRREVNRRHDSGRYYVVVRLLTEDDPKQAAARSHNLVRSAKRRRFRSSVANPAEPLATGSADSNQSGDGTATVWPG